jgi:dTDP-4-dehydrorhamnose 3,5-epimerase
MIFKETSLCGVRLIEPDRFEDDRGYFVRTWCRNEFEAAGLGTFVAQCNVSFNRFRGTLRGMHFQRKPHEQAKLVRCSGGAIYDVLIDLRPGSPTHLKWAAFELTAANLNLLYVPEGLAHGFQTLVDDTEVQYQMGDFYHPECEGGLRYDDPAFNVAWPLPPQCVSKRDRAWLPFGKPGNRGPVDE